MPILVSENELAGLLDSPEELVRAVDATLRSVESSHSSGRGHAIFGDLGLEGEGPNHAMVLGTAAPGQRMSVRVFPSPANRTNAPHSKLMFFFDGNGSLLAILAGDGLNELRTSVPAALGARHLAPDGARRLGVLGSGAQAHSHARTITAACPQLEEIDVWSPTPANREEFARRQEELLGLPVHARETAEEVVGAADVLTAAGRTRPGAAAYDPAWVKPGSLLISMTRSAPPELLGGQASLVVPTLERPELVALGFSGPAAPRPGADPDHAIQLIDVIEGRAQAREHDEHTVVWELGNVYPWDLAIMGWAYEWALENGVGTSFDFSSQTLPGAA